MKFIKNFVVSSALILGVDNASFASNSQNADIDLDHITENVNHIMVSGAFQGPLQIITQKYLSNNSTYSSIDPDILALAFTSKAFLRRTLDAYDWSISESRFARDLSQFQRKYLVRHISHAMGMNPWGGNPKTSIEILNDDPLPLIKTITINEGVEMDFNPKGHAFPKVLFNRGCNYVRASGMTDEILENVTDSLYSLTLYGPGVTNKGLTSLKSRKVKQLSLFGTEMTQEGLATFLAQGHPLEFLEISGIPLSLDWAEFLPKGMNQMILYKEDFTPESYVAIPTIMAKSKEITFKERDS